MLARLRAKLTYANVVATLALFLALGGASYAAVRVTSGSIVNNTVRSVDVRNNEIRSRDIRNRTIVARDVLSNQILGSHVRESSLGKVPDADTLDGQDSAAFKVSCPGGTAFHAGACIETTTRPSADYKTASRVCGSAGRRLASYDELNSFRDEPNVTLFAFFELTSDVLSLNADAAGQGTAAAINDTGGNDVVSIVGESHPYRCVAPLAN